MPPIEEEADRITAHEKVADHVSAGLALLAQQFRDKAGVEGLAAAWLAQVQDLEDVLWALLEQSAIDDAEGDRLDQVGDLLGLPRGALADDADYRAVLRAGARARKSNGRPEDVIEVAGLALGAVDFDYVEGAASIAIEPRAPVGFDGAALIAVLRLAKCAGVQIQAFDPPAAESLLFTFSTSLLPQADASRGLSDVTQAAGGKLTRVRG